MKEIENEKQKKADAEQRAEAILHHAMTMYYLTDKLFKAGFGRTELYKKYEVSSCLSCGSSMNFQYDALNCSLRENPGKPLYMIQCSACGDAIYFECIDVENDEWKISGSDFDFRNSTLRN